MFPSRATQYTVPANCEFVSNVTVKAKSVLPLTTTSDVTFGASKTMVGRAVIVYVGDRVLGDLVGIRVGTGDGDIVTTYDGGADGTSVGTAVGISVTTYEGGADGTFVGMVDGDLVGSLVGTEVGLFVGTRLGNSVGA